MNKANILNAILRNVRDKDLKYWLMVTKMAHGDKNIGKDVKVNCLIDCWLLNVQRQIFDTYEEREQV